MPMVLHGGVIHLLFNSYALYVLGPQVERVFGTWRFLAIYLGGRVGRQYRKLRDSPLIRWPLGLRVRSLA